jgi:cbb3-type cytochrome oxidase maturation protein
MDILYLLVPLSVVLAFAIGVAFWRAVDGGQFDDLDRPALDVLLDDDRPAPGPGQAIEVPGAPRNFPIPPDPRSAATRRATV